MVIYVVREGDSVYSIAKMFGVDPNIIIADNELADPNSLVVGQTLVIFTDRLNYTIGNRDRISNLLNQFNITFEDLIRLNPNLTNPNAIFAGENLVIPIVNNPLGPMEVNGYAFANITDEVLDKTLPHLTYLSIFSYQVRTDGSVMAPPGVDRLLAKARQYNVAPLMVITNIDEEGGFSSELVAELFESEEAQENLINNILQTLNENNYYGVNVDFEYVFAENRDDYSNFLRRLTEVMHNNGYIVTSAVAPKISDDMPGILYEGHDYVAIGEIVDRVIIMTYEWGYTYGPPLAVAPLDRVEEVLEYAVTVIPRDKILMGIPNYGYDWNLPYVPGTAARVVTNTGAVDLARNVGAFIQFDEPAQSPYFTYWTSTGEHIVWFEDARSIDAKLRLAFDYGLAGVSYWTINRFFPQNWLVLDYLYDVIKVV